jgi:hypothetical protein
MPLRNLAKNSAGTTEIADDSYQHFIIVQFPITMFWIRVSGVSQANVQVARRNPGTT